MTVSPNKTWTTFGKVCPLYPVTGLSDFFLLNASYVKKATLVHRHERSRITLRKSNVAEMSVITWRLWRRYVILWPLMAFLHFWSLIVFFAWCSDFDWSVWLILLLLHASCFFLFTSWQWMGSNYLRQTQTHNFCLTLTIILSPINTTRLKPTTAQQSLQKLSSHAINSTRNILLTFLLFYYFPFVFIIFIVCNRIEYEVLS